LHGLNALVVFKLPQAPSFWSSLTGLYS
jgi:hypothetical protein